MQEAMGLKQGRCEIPRFATNRWVIPAVGLTLVLIVSTAPTPAEADTFGGVVCKIITFGQGCKPFRPAPAPAPADPTVSVNCSKPVMTSAPQFLSTPKGAAKYPFSATCNSPERPGTMMVRWEGSWTPSETQADRPNASETLTITGYEPFIPGREAGAKIFMYWTARCTGDPWLQGGTCHRYGGYIPDDLRQAFPDIDSQSFPRTANQMTPSLRQQLVADYQRVNSQLSMSNPGNRQNLQAMMGQLQQSQAVIPQSQQGQAMMVQPQVVLPKPPGTMGSVVPRRQILGRGVDPVDNPDAATQPQEEPAASDDGPFDATLGGINYSAGSVAIKLDRPLHFMTAKGEDIVVPAGVYQIEPKMDLYLSLEKEGQAPVLLQALPGTHTETIPQPVGLLIQGKQDDLFHLVFLMPDGGRLETAGSVSGVRPRSDITIAGQPNNRILQVATPAPPCQPSPFAVGPRYLPVPCTLALEGGTYTGDLVPSATVPQTHPR